MNEYVENKVGMPGAALAAVGALSVLANLAGLAYTIATAGLAAVNMVQAGVGMDAWIAWLSSAGWMLLVQPVYLIAAIIVLMAGLRLRGARSAGLVYAGSVFAMLPCCVGLPCCCLGLPIGIWAIVTMQDDQVKAAFAEY